MSDGVSFYFDAESVAADLAVINSMVLTKCTRSGEPELFQLLPFQKKLIANLLGWKHADGSRVYRRCYFSTGRKNGKTELIAALALLLLIDPTEAQPEIYAAAKSRDQSAFLFSAAAALIDAHEELRELLQVIPHKMEIRNPQNGGLLKALSSEGKTKHGSNPSAVLIDELHTWSSGEQELYDALVSGTAARRSPLIVFTSTAGVGHENLPDHHGQIVIEHELQIRICQRGAEAPRGVTLKEFFSVPIRHRVRKRAIRDTQPANSRARHGRRGDIKLPR
jgi:phage terminase large subunit-like protein